MVPNAWQIDDRAGITLVSRDDRMPLEKKRIERAKWQMEVVVSIREKGVGNKLKSQPVCKDGDRARHGYVREFEADCADGGNGESEGTAPPTPRWLRHLEERSGHGHIREFEADGADKGGGEGEGATPPAPRWLGYLRKDKPEMGIDPGHE